MTRSLWIMAATALLSLGSISHNALAENSQQTKMTRCNADATAKNLSGADRKTYLKTCLSANAATPSPTLMNSQQQKMKSCNADVKTKGLTGAERKKYMSDCLKGSP